MFPWQQSSYEKLKEEIGKRHQGINESFLDFVNVIDNYFNQLNPRISQQKRVDRILHNMQIDLRDRILEVEVRSRFGNFRTVDQLKAVAYELQGKYSVAAVVNPKLSNIVQSVDNRVPEVPMNQDNVQANPGAVQNQLAGSEVVGTLNVILEKFITAMNAKFDAIEARYPDLTNRHQNEIPVVDNDQISVTVNDQVAIGVQNERLAGNGNLGNGVLKTNGDNSKISSNSPAVLLVSVCGEKFKASVDRSSSLSFVG